MSTVEPVATVVNGHTFTVDDRYVLSESRILGKGSFGVVTTAFDSVRKIDLAIKRIRPYANDDWDAKHTLREIRLLKLLGPHPNIISLYELSLFLPKTELYMMMELMDCDLHRVIQSKQSLSEKHHKCFLKQMLEGIKAMHSIGVFHRDLKPGNILVSKDCQLRITDFGLARFMDASTRRGENELNPMTQYVVTRWYRPPELLLAPNLPYGEPVDLWSIGCILAELLRRKPLFPGKSHLNQAQLIFELKGYTSAKELGFPVSAEAASFLDKKCRYRKQSIRKYVPDASEAAISLLELLLAVNPSQRPTAEQALQHPFLADAEVLHDYSKTYLTRPTPDYFEFEHTAFTVPELRAMIEHEVEISAADAYRYPKQQQQQRGGSPGTKRRGQWQGDDSSTAANTEEPVRVMSQKTEPVHPSDTHAGIPANNPFNNNKTALRRPSRAGEEAMMRDGTAEEEGPPSQMPTPRQVARAVNAVQSGLSRSDKASTSNPFRNQAQAGAGGSTQAQAQSARDAAAAGNVTETQPVKDRPKSSEEIGQAAAAYRGYLLSSRSEKHLHTEDTTDVVPAHAIPAGNILTAVRNEANPSHIPPGSRTKTPKTPSPKKMDQILQKDMLNKRRFLIQQQAAEREAANSATMTTQQGPSYGTRSTNRFNYANSSSAMQDVMGGGVSGVALGTGRAQQQQQQQSTGGASGDPQQQVSRFGKLVPTGGAVPFPSIASRMSSVSNRANGGAGNGASGSRKVQAGSSQGNSSGGDVAAAVAAAAMNTHHSNTILHSGSNVINSDYGNGNQL